MTWQVGGALKGSILSGGGLRVSGDSIPEVGDKNTAGVYLGRINDSYRLAVRDHRYSIKGDDKRQA